MAPQASRIGETLGGEVSGIDLSKPLSEEQRAFIQVAWNEHLVLRFREQSLEDEHLLALAEALGGTQEAGSRRYFVDAGSTEKSGRISRHPGISIISNLDEDGKPVLKHAGTGSLELGWHTDNSYVERPPKGTVLYGLEVPVDGGGDTEFLNQYAAYESLPTELRHKIDGLHTCQDTSRNTAGLARPGARLPRSRDEVSGPVHAMVRVHPETGRKALYLGRRYARPSSYVVELGEDEGEALLDELWAHATQVRFKWSHQWRDGDLLMWDNRCTLHRRTAADPGQPRVMHRALIRGEPVIPAA
jgi:taurine dioxygenase